MADKKKAAAPEKKPATKKGACYEVSGESLKRKNKSCPKCGPGIFMAAHKDRYTCGKCGYMEKKSE
jgi:small subunit ribosomal protein S27Ae